jgi:hypothetical protein
MTLYTVLAPAPRQGETRPDPLALVFIKEGFCWPALFVPALWLLFRRLWLVLALAIIFAVAVGILGGQAGVAIPFAITLLARLWFAIEANGLRRWTYRLYGYRLIDVVEAGNLREAELRYFLEWPAIVPAPPPEKAVIRDASPEAGEVIGLFPSAGGAA